MTAAIAAGAAAHRAETWHAIDWRKVHRTVRRLQARIVRAVRAGRWGKAKALQRLLTHSFAAKALAVKRVTSNPGKWTPGVDGVLWSTPATNFMPSHPFRNLLGPGRGGQVLPQR